MRNNIGNVGLIELALILIVLILLLSIFRDQAVDFVQKVFALIIGK